MNNEDMVPFEIDLSVINRGGVMEAVDYRRFSSSVKRVLDSIFGGAFAPVKVKGSKHYLSLSSLTSSALPSTIVVLFLKNDVRRRLPHLILSSLSICFFEALIFPRFIKTNKENIARMLKNIAFIYLLLSFISRRNISM